MMILNYLKFLFIGDINNINAAMVNNSIKDKFGSVWTRQNDDDLDLASLYCQDSNNHHRDEGIA
eukprot:2683159-Ditylum_brightwellii.AAC.1